MTSNEFDELNEQMLFKLMEINPDCATVSGMHEPFDRHLPQGGFQKIKDSLGLLEEWTRRADNVAASSPLSGVQEVSHQVLRFTLETYKFAVDDYPLWRMRPEAIEHPGTAMLMMLVRDYAPISARLAAMAARLGEMPRYLEQFRGRFAGTRTVRIWTEAALETCKAFPSFLDSSERLSSAHLDADTRTEMTRSVAGVKEELRTHTTWLEKMLDSATEDFAMGKDRYAKLMKIRGIPYTPDELLALSTEYLDEYKRRRETIGKTISGGGSVEDARKIVESDCPSSIDEVVDRTKVAVARAKEFILQHDLVSIPFDSRIHVMKTPDFLGGSTPWAATYLPAVFERSQDTVFLIGGSGDQKILGSTYNYHTIDCTAVHEAHPGHHHQGVMSNRRPWMHQLPHIMYTPETVSPPYESQEGWATYCERMMREKGFLGSDRHLLSILDYSVWTACRVFSDIKLSCGEATVDDMVDLAVSESGYPREFAEADVKGFTVLPGYGICYLVGRHLVNGLKRDLQQHLGHKFSEKRFHDLVAENGNLPFYLLEGEVKTGMEQQNST